MNFIEAVTALNEGRCEAIKRANTSEYSLELLQRSHMAFEAYTATEWEEEVRG